MARKYRPTDTICSLEEFENCDATWYQVNHSGRKMWHRSALESLQTRTLMNWLYSGDIQACEKINDTKDEEPKPLSPVMQFWADRLVESLEPKYEYVEVKNG